LKKWSFNGPLLFKLTSLVLVVTLLSVGVTTFFVAELAQRSLENRAKEDLSADAQMISLSLSEAWAERSANPQALQEQIEFLERATKRTISIVDAAGQVAAGSDPGALDLTKHFMAAAPLADGAQLQVFMATDELSGISQMIVEGSILIAILVAASAVVVAFFVNRSITTPIQDLLGLVRSLQERQFGRMVLVRSTDEIGQLGRAFNELSEILDDLFQTISSREGQLDTILSSMDDGVIAVNMRRAVILANRAAADLFDLPDDVIGQNIFEATRHEELTRILEKTMDSRETFTSEVRARPGSEQTIAITSSPLQDQRGKIQGAVAVMRDVTSLRHLEQMRQEFVSNVSHELRTPLTSIKGFVETLLNGHLEDRQLLERFLNIIAAETDRMISLINDLLDLSRIESGKLKINRAAVDMKKVFDDTVLLLQSKAEEKQIELSNNIYDPIVVEGDEKLLRQVALNLVDNGVKYTPEGGKVWIEAEQGLDHVEFIVADTGVGIASEHLDRIFERFYRVDKGRSRQTGGTGLGLAIVKHIIDRHKGTIAVESRVGKGTKIRITLRRAN